MNIKELQHKMDGDTFGVYSSIPILAAPGIHEEVFRLLTKQHLNKNTRILVLGTGAGAFDKRLIDAGYTDITAVDLIGDNYKVKGTKFFERDLNKDFSDLGTFDAIVAIEVIEHIENQFHFMRCIKKMLAEGGALYVTTPNVENSFSRIKYFLTGKLHFFSKEELYGTGHITPILRHVFDFNLQQNNLVIDTISTNGNVWKNVGRGRSLLLRCAYVLLHILVLPIQRKNNFDILIYKIRHVS